MSQVLFTPDDTGKMRIAASVGNGPATNQFYETGGAMRGEQTPSVAFRVPDITYSDGIEYMEIEVLVEMASADIRETAELVKTLERPLTERE